MAEFVEISIEDDLRSEASFTVVGSPEVYGGSFDTLDVDKICPQSPRVFTAAGESAASLPDLTLVSSNHVLFHAHKRRLLLSSGNGFAGLLLSNHDTSTSLFRPIQEVQVDEDAAVLSVVLSAIYDTPTGSLAPLETLALAVKALIRYKVPVQELAVPRRPLGEQLLAHAPLAAIDVFVLAAEHALEAIAVQASSHLLAYPLLCLPDELALRMGGRYLHRLYVLQHTRIVQLKNMLYAPLESHPAMPRCGHAERIRLQRAWAAAVASLAWEANASVSSLALQRALLAVEPGAQVTCAECKQVLWRRIAAMTKAWTVLQNTV